MLERLVVWILNTCGNVGGSIILTLLALLAVSWAASAVTLGIVGALRGGKGRIGKAFIGFLFGAVGGPLAVAVALSDWRRSRHESRLTSGR